MAAPAMGTVSWVHVSAYQDIRAQTAPKVSTILDNFSLVQEYRYGSRVGEPWSG